MASRVLLLSITHNRKVTSKNFKINRTFPPYELLLIASLLRDNSFEVELVDLNVQYQTIEQLQKMSDDADFVVVTTNPYSDWQCPNYDIAEALNFVGRLQHSNKIIIGNHGTHFPKAVAKSANAKYIIRDEPELKTLELITTLQANANVSSLSNVSIFDGENIYHGPMEKLGKMTELPLPAYDLIDVGNYFYELLGENFALVEASRGCPYSCTFCNLSMFQNGYRKDTADRVNSIIDDLVLNHNCRSVYIFDLEFTINKKMVDDICDHIIQKDYVSKFGFKWCCQTRADSVNHEMLVKMKKAGCELIHFGVESGNEDILASTKKRINKEKIKTGIKLAEKAGIRTAGFFILGHPQESYEQMKETLNFSKELDLTYASFHPYLSFPGSPKYVETFGEGPFDSDKLPVAVTFMDEEKEKFVSQFVKKCYLNFYLRPVYIIKFLFRANFSLVFKQLKLWANQF